MTTDIIHPPSTQSNHLTHPKYRPDIDGLRAIAVLSVVIYHAFPKFIRGGFIGVDIFFVISGFLISTIIIGSLERNSFNFIYFYSRRIKRIFPALLLVLTASFVFGWFVLLADEYKQLGKHIAGGASFISNFMYWNESGYFDNAAETKPLLHLWSLGIEEQFYIVWPLLLWLAWKKRFNLLTITIVVAVISFALNISKVQGDTVAAFYSPQTRFWELLVGSILAYMTLHRRSIFPKLKHKLNMWLGQITNAQAQETNGKILHNVQSLVGAALILIGLLITKQGHFPGWWAILPTVGALLIISAGVHSWFNRVVLSNRVLVWFGLISYPLYLWHWPLLSFVRIMESGTPSHQIRIVVVLISIALAWMTYRFVERPIRFGKHSKQKTIILFFLTIIVGFSGYISFKYSGFELRRVNTIPYALDSALNNYAIKFNANKNYLDDIVRDRQVAIRAPYCHYNKPGQSFNEYKSGMGACLVLSISKRNVLIIGDSHAADLYVALNHSFSTNYNFLQATGAGCTPDKNYNAKGICNELQGYAINFAKNNPLSSIIIAGRWSDLDDNGLLSLMTEIKSFNKNIYLVSPPVSYTADVPKIIQRNRMGRTQYMLSQQYLDRKVLDLNIKLKNFALTNHIKYIDRIELFCNKEVGCSLVSENGDLYTIDYGHVGRMGAYHLGEMLMEKNISFE